MEFSTFYKQLLGRGDHGIVTDARLAMGEGEVVLSIEDDGKDHVCPECGKTAKLRACP